MIKKIIRKNTLKVLLIFFFWLMATSLSLAQDEPIINQAMKNALQSNQLSVDYFLCVFINVMRIILGIIGGLTLLMFVWGGIQWLISGGNADQVEKGKKTVANASIGLVLVFTSYLIVWFVIFALGGQPGNILNFSVNCPS